MKIGTFTVEVVLTEDINAFHDELIDFEKDLAAALDSTPRVVVFKITNADNEKSYNGIQLGTAANAAVERTITTQRLHATKELSRKNGDF